MIIFFNWFTRTFFLNEKLTDLLTKKMLHHNMSWYTNWREIPDIFPQKNKQKTCYKPDSVQQFTLYRDFYHK